MLKIIVLRIASFFGMERLSRLLVKKINNQKDLVKVLLTAKYSTVMMAVLEKLDDQKLFSALLMDDHVIYHHLKNQYQYPCDWEGFRRNRLKRIDLWLFALDKLDGIKSVKDVAINTTWMDCFREAISKITDPDDLVEIAVSRNYGNISFNYRIESVFLALIDKIQDDLKLKTIVLEATDQPIKEAALSKITDIRVLAEIIISSGDNILRSTEIYAIIDKIKDDLLLVNIFNKVKSSQIKIYTAEKIEDISSILPDLVTWEQIEKDNYVRLRIANLIGDKALIEKIKFEIAEKKNTNGLIELYTYSPDIVNLNKLASVNTLSYLLEIFLNAKSDWVKTKAAERLDTRELVNAICGDGISYRAAYCGAEVLADREPGSLKRALKQGIKENHALKIVCGLVGHDHGENCVCRICGTEEHTFDENESLSENKSSGTCNRCGAVLTWITSMVTETCPYCHDGVVDMYSSLSGEGGGWEETCSYCKGTGEHSRQAVTRRVTYKDNSSSSREI
ncbi:MAG: YuiA family protein [Odoribacteraceae bacterium]|jgi:hypothetical protein|nr:YuiA family protein [Odoribacteraceae bacterium]